MQENGDTVRRLRECEGVGEKNKLLADFFARHRSRLRWAVGLRLDRRLRSRVDASDVLQEAYLEASRRLPDYLRDRPMPLYLWLRRIAVQKLLEIHRLHMGVQKRAIGREISMCRNVGPLTDSVTLAAGLVAEGTNPSRMAQRAEVRSQLEEALEKMSPVDREILALRHFEQLSNTEAADLLGIEKAAARKRYLRALKKLRQIVTATAGGLEEASP